MSKVKIVSSWTKPGGGTIAHIALTNLLNANGYDCTLYGPHDWAKGKCKFDTINNSQISPDDILISHFINIPPSLKAKKHILYCHEKHLLPLKEVDLSSYDHIVFVSEEQKTWQGIDFPHSIIPSPVDKFKWKNPENNFAGVIGSIDRNKQTHVSIERALNDGFTKVVLFGDVTDLAYFNENVNVYLESGDVYLSGHQDDREAMYGSVCEVYHSSLSETYGLVEAECRVSGIPFNGKSNNQIILTDQEILDLWKPLLQ